MATISWLDDEDPLDDDWDPKPSARLDGTEAAANESVRCGVCGQPASSWIYLVGNGEDGNQVIDGHSVCATHKAAAA